MNKEQLIIKAKELGIKDAETLTVDQLKVSIKNAEFWNELVLKAESLGIKDTDGLSNEELSQLILATENTKLGEVNEALTAKIQVLADVLGIENFDALNVEDLFSAASEKLTLLSKTQEAPKKKEVVGKTKKTFKHESGKVYGFTQTAPSAFRYAGTVKTQEEWISDEAAMNLMIAGGLNYVEQLKK